MATRDEILRFLIEVAGEQNLDALGDALASLDSRAKAGEGSAQALASELDKLVDVAKGAERFQQLSAALEDTSRQLQEASDGLVALNKEFDATDSSSKRVADAYKAAENEISRLTAQQIKQREALARLSDELEKSGVDSRNLADEQTRLRTTIDRTTAEIVDQAAAAKRAAADQAALSQRLEQQDAAFRAQAAASRTAREALQRYREGAAQASTAQDKLAASSERSVGIFSRLRGALAGLGAFFGVREAVQGAANILRLGDSAERARAQLAGLYGSQEAGARAFEGLRDLAKQNGQEFDGLLAAATRLKAFGLDPLDGTLQALIDQNARLGGSQQELEGIVLAVGQAWAKQKLQGEEILQLVERGVPVWELLQKATGKNVQELQRLSEAGKLGRAEIKLLLDEIGRSAEGAAAEGLGRLSGLVQQLRDRVTQFFTDVSNSGALEFFKQRLQALITEFDQLQKSGDLAAFAKRFSDAMIASAKAVEGAARFVVQYSGALIELGKAYLAIKVAGFLTGMAQSAAAMLAAGQAAASTAQKVGGLRGALAAIPANIKIGIAAVGLEVLISRVIDLRGQLEELRDAQQDLLDSDRAAASLRSKLVAEIDAAIAANEKYRQTQIRTAEDLQAYGEAELRLYQDRINAAARYYAALEQQATALGDTTAAAAARAELEKYREALNGVIDRFGALKQAKEDGFSSPESQGLRQAFERLKVDAELAGAKITETGKQVIADFSQIASSTEASAKQIGAALNNALNMASTTAEVDKLRTALYEAYEAGRISAAEYERGAALAAARTREIQSAAGQAAAGVVDLVRDFERLATSGNATAAQISAALAGAISSAKTQQEIDRLRAALGTAFSSGIVNAAQYQQALEELKKKMQELGIQLPNLGNNVGNLGGDFQQLQQDTNDTGDGLRNLGKALEDTAYSFGAVSQQALEALVSMNQYVGQQSIWVDRINSVSAAIRAQRESLDLMNKQLDEQLARFDPLQERLQQLKRDYSLLDEAQLREIAQKQEQLEREEERLTRESERVQKETERAQQRGNAGGSSGGTSPRPSGGASAAGGAVNITVNIDGLIGDVDRSALEQFARQLKPILERIAANSR